MQVELYVDITNYLDTRLNTGIQRVVREFLIRAKNDVRYKLYILYYCSNKNSYFDLSEDIQSILEDIKSYKLNFSKNITLNSKSKSKRYFFDLDRVWNSYPKREILYNTLKSYDFYIINYIYDLIPILKPEYFYKETKENFPKYLESIFTYSDCVYFDSYSCKKDFTEYKKKQKIYKNIHTDVLHLGADISLTNNKINIEKYKSIFNSRYLLFVGTIEPRKKHLQMIEVFDELIKDDYDLNLIFIGKYGWNIKSTKDKITNHKLYNKKIFHFEDINDNELVEFYKHSFIVCYLSEYEGFGLPIAEALYYNKIVITSNNSSLKEISDITYNLNDSTNIINTIKKYADDDFKYNSKVIFNSKFKKIIFWDNFYDNFVLNTINL